MDIDVGEAVEKANTFMTYVLAVLAGIGIVLAILMITSCSLP